MNIATKIIGYKLICVSGFLWMLFVGNLSGLIFKGQHMSAYLESVFEKYGFVGKGGFHEQLHN